MSLAITIGGTDVTSLIERNTFALTNAIGQRDTLALAVKSDDASYRPEVGAPVVVTHTDLGVLFGGTIRRGQTALRGLSITSGIQCASWEQIFDRRVVGQVSFTDQPAGDVFQFLFDNYLAAEGLTASIVASGPNISYSFDWCSAREAFDKICELASDESDTYLWDCTPGKVTRFYLQSSFPAPINVTEARTDIFRNITVTRSFDGYVNKVFVRLGQFITDPRDNTFGPDGTQDTLTFELPIAKAPTVTIDAVEKTVGIRDVDTGKDCYWQDGSPDVVFAVAPADGTTVVITAQGYQSTVIDAGQNNDEVTERSIAEGNSGWYTAVIERSTPGTMADALAYGQAYLAKFSKVPYAVEYATTYGGIKAGQYQTITLTKFGPDFTATFVIESSTLVQENGQWFWRIRAINGALANNWLSKLRKLATGTSTSTGGGGTSISTGNTLALTPALSSGLVGVPYSGPLVATGGQPPYTFSIAAGALPTWATLDAATGIISGTPDDVATTDFTARVTDVSTVTADADCALIIADAGVAPNAAPGDVTIDSVTVDPRRTMILNKRGLSAGSSRGVELKYTPPDPLGTFLGVVGTVEAPDQSAADYVPLDGSVSLGGGRRLGGPKDSAPIGPFAHADVAGVFRFSVAEPHTYPMVCRVRLMSYSAVVTNDADTSPSLTFTIAAPTTEKPNAGVAFCENPTAVSVVETSNPKSHGVLMRRVRVSMTPPSDPKFAGVQWIVKDAAGETVCASGIQAEAEFELLFQELSAPQTCTVYACGSDGENINPLVEDITPSATFDAGTIDGTIDLGQSAVASMGLGLGSDGTTLSVKIAGPIYEDIAGNINLKISPHFVVSGAGELTQDIVDLALATNFDTSAFSLGANLSMNPSWITAQAIACNQLVAGNALFAGDATFARSGGGKVTINSAGLALADHNTSPNSTLTLASTGATVAKGSNNVQVTASGVAINGPSGTLTATSSGVVISNGSSSVTVSSSSVAIVNGSLTSPVISGGSLTITSGTKTLVVNATNSFRITDSASGIETVADAVNVYVKYATGASAGLISQMLPGQVVTANAGGFSTGHNSSNFFAQGFPGIYGAITYAKPGGGSGTLTFVGGIITAYT